jgi:malate dehydrogenase (oxaloacetate-decarboxylating)(NADP+)
MPDSDRPWITEDEALRYHAGDRPGKIEVVASKPLSSQYDLSLAYSPGVAAPCRRIAEDPDASYRYTARGNLVAVVTNGTAVLGLGAIGPRASKPVMEGKAVLFKRFAGIDVFDLEVDADSPAALIETVERLQVGFGGINLEDISRRTASRWRPSSRRAVRSRSCTTTSTARPSSPGRRFSTRSSLPENA